MNNIIIVLCLLIVGMQVVAEGFELNPLFYAVTRSFL